GYEYEKEECNNGRVLESEDDGINLDTLLMVMEDKIISKGKHQDDADDSDEEEEEIKFKVEYENVLEEMNLQKKKNQKLKITLKEDEFHISLLENRLS
ncbi:hypothetical protein KI387_031667, partial [Taxus chinensis]